MERALGPPGSGSGSLRLTARFTTNEEGAAPAMAELQRELEELVERLNELTLPPLAALPAARAERSLAELVETYRPRQRELVDLLHEEGELTSAEHALLIQHLASTPDQRGEVVPPPTETERLIATVPIDRQMTVPARPDLGAPVARTVPELLRTYQIASLRQAGAVRARRQISFAEYMALKRHFETGGADALAGTGERGSS